MMIDYYELVSKGDGEYDFIVKKDKESTDIVEKPAHYTEGKQFEPRAVAEDWGLIDNGYKYDALAYLARAGSKLYDGKDSVESEIIDLKKAIQNLKFRIQQLEKEKKA